MRLYHLLLALVPMTACGGDSSGHLPDAPTTGDARGDASALPVKLTVTSDGVPAASVRVYFLNPDSSLVASAQTGSDGVASALVETGGSVTALEPSEGSAIPPGLDTFAGVVPGDDLHLDLVTTPPAPTTTTFPISLPADGNATIDLEGSCSLNLDTPTSVTGTNCGATVDLMVVARDSVGGQVVGTIFVPGQAIADGQAVTIAGPYVAAVPDTVTFANVPASYINVLFQKQLLTARGGVIDTSGEAMGGSGSGSGLVTMTGMLAFPPAASTPNTTQVLSFDPGDRNAAFDNRTAIVWGPATSTTNLDLSTLAPLGYASSPSFDTTTQAVSWTPGTSGVAPDGVITSVRIGRTSGALSQWTWNLVAPPGATVGTVTLPTLPTDVFTYNTMPGDTALIDRLDTLQVPGGYAALRPHAFSSGFAAAPVVGGSGQILLTTLSE